MVLDSAYPPAQHMLRDLALTVEHHEDGSSAGRLPVVDAVLDDHGRVRAGVIATLVDAIGGGLAAYAAAPGWIATADLDLQLTGASTVDAPTVDAFGRVLRAGRSTVVIAVDLRAGPRALGLATMTFTVLPRRDTNPVMPVDRVRGPQSFLSGDTTSGFAGAALDAFGIRTVDAALGAVELEPSPYVENSLGAVQGGVVATIAERAGELALSAAAGEALAPVGLQLTYLALAREGPIRSEVSVLGIAPAWGSARVELFDAGAGRRTTVARVAAARPR